MRKIINVMERDIRVFFSYRFMLASLIAMTLTDLFIMAIVFNRIIDKRVFFNYDFFSYLTPGISVMALFAAAYTMGREVNWETRRGFTHYLLSLPIRRSVLVTGRILSGGLRGMMLAMPLHVLALIILKVPSVQELLILWGFMFIVGSGLAGLSVLLGGSSKSFEFLVVTRGITYFFLFFVSTIFYPITIIRRILPEPLPTMAEYNPISGMVEMLRSVLLDDYPLMSGIEVNHAVRLLITSVSFLILGIAMYYKLLRNP